MKVTRCGLRLSGAVFLLLVNVACERDEGEHGVLAEPVLAANSKVVDDPEDGIGERPNGIPPELEVDSVVAPEWVRAGTQRMPDGKLLGVAAFGGSRNSSLAQVTADNRARAEIAQLLTEDHKSPNRKGHEAVLRGVRIVERWHSPQGKWYSLAQWTPQSADTDSEDGATK
ncbi:MAG: hypothetical protein R3C68_09130 [Myxococcota bacterium]